MYTNFLAEIDHLRDENEKLIQALEEIREILCTNCSFEELLNRNNDKNINKIDKVVKLINEVLKDE